MLPLCFFITIKLKLVNQFLTILKLNIFPSIYTLKIYNPFVSSMTDIFLKLEVIIFLFPEMNTIKYLFKKANELLEMD